MYTGSNPRLLREQSVSYLLPRMMELGYEDALKYAVQKQREDAESMLAERARKEASWDGEGEPPFDADDIEGFAMVSRDWWACCGWNGWVCLAALD